MKQRITIICLGLALAFSIGFNVKAFTDLGEINAALADYCFSNIEETDRSIRITFVPPPGPIQPPVQVLVIADSDADDVTIQ